MFKVGDKVNYIDDIGIGILSKDNPYTVLYADEKGILVRDLRYFTAWEELEAAIGNYKPISEEELAAR